jgi:glutamyl-tRNA synthetase
MAVVVDDADMGVTDILRGDDHLSNTPKQVLLYRALGLNEPRFGHVPMILGPDGKKLSKRHGAVSVMEYEKQGFLPEAMVNYLVRLGWASGDQEIFSMDELAEQFDVKGLSSSAARFDTDKLKWLNAHYIKEKDPAGLVPVLARRFDDLGREDLDPALLEQIVRLYQPRAQTMLEMAEQAEFFVTPDDELAYDEKAVDKFLTDEARGYLAEIKAVLADLEDFSHDALDAALRGYVEEKDLKFKAVAQPIRVAISGKTQSPGLFETMEVLGRDSTLNRMEAALAL